jgi:DNA-binding CsgD family transcriptional regulator
LARHYLSGKPAALNRAQLSSANVGDGLNVVICFAGLRRDGLSREQSRAVREKQSAEFHRGLGGYCIKELLADSIGHESLQRMLHAGFRLRRTYSNHFRRHDLPLPASFLRPWLVGLTREEAFAHLGSNVAGLFVWAPPRFHFNPSEQILLLHALQEETGAELAASLCISPWTVKKRWQAIYQRVANIDGELLPPIAASGSPTASRGVERRRHLLNYLRQHPEELRPSSQERKTRSPRNSRNVCASDYHRIGAH